MICDITSMEANPAYKCAHILRYIHVQKTKKKDGYKKGKMATSPQMGKLELHWAQHINIKTESIIQQLILSPIERAIVDRTHCTGCSSTVYRVAYVSSCDVQQQEAGGI